MKNKIAQSKENFLQALINTPADRLSGTDFGGEKFPQIQKTSLRKSVQITGDTQYKFNFRLTANNQDRFADDILLDEKDVFYPLGANLYVQELDPTTKEPVGIPFPYTYPDKVAFGAAAAQLWSVYNGTWSFESDGSSIYKDMSTKELLRIPQVQQTADELPEYAGCNTCCPLYNDLMLFGSDTMDLTLNLGAPSARPLLTAAGKMYIMTFEICGFLYRGSIGSARLCQVNPAV